MSFLDKLFGKADEVDELEGIRFGRYTDTYKKKGKYISWDKSIELFEEKQYMQSLRCFLDFLLDEKESNLTLEETEVELSFNLYQGSKSIHGICNEKGFVAHAKIARTSELKIGFLRRLLDQNYQLKYSKFCLDKDDNIVLKFDSFIEDATPHKLYYALKELATKADKLDDVLVDEFQSLSMIDSGHIIQIPIDEFEVKYAYLTQQIKYVLDDLDNGKLNVDRFPGGASYALLNLVYKLDYLLKPEGFIMDKFESIHRVYFNNDGKDAASKNRFIKKELMELIERPKLDYQSEFYRVVSTFGIATPASHDSLVTFIDSELSNIDWYIEQKHDLVGMSIPSYIAGYCLFNYSLPMPDVDLLHLYFEIMDQDFFNALGSNDIYMTNTGFNEKMVVNKIKEIKTDHKLEFPNFKPDIKSLNFSSPAAFAKSYLFMCRNVDLTNQN